MRSVPWQVKYQFDVFTIAQAFEAGWSPAALKHATSTGHLIRLRRGAYAVAETTARGHELERLRLGQRGVVAALRVPAATVSHASAVGPTWLATVAAARLAVCDIAAGATHSRGRTSRAPATDTDLATRSGAGSVHHLRRPQLHRSDQGRRTRQRLGGGGLRGAPQAVHHCGTGRGVLDTAWACRPQQR